MDGWINLRGNEAFIMCRRRLIYVRYAREKKKRNKGARSTDCVQLVGPAATVRDQGAVHDVAIECAPAVEVPFGDRGGWAGPRLSFSSDGGGAAVTAAAGSARIEKRRVGRTVSSE
jgi:hypothetical protein